jgi:kumamolisin
LFAKPSYQTGPGTTNTYSNGERQVPDVTGDADPASGYSIYSQGSWTVVGGTSAAAPLWAGIATLSNHYAASNGKANMGQPHSTFYGILGNATKYASDFHDITSGTNRHFPATTGYDQASGIGSPNAYNLVLDINGSGGGGTPTPTPTTTITPTPTTTTPPPTTTTPVPTTTPTGGQLIKNGGFESGNTSWTESSSGGYEIVDSTTSSKHHTGSASGWLAGYNNGNDAIYQAISIPSSASSVTLTFWVYVSTQETSHSYDFFYAKVRNSSGTSLATVTTLSDATATGWKQYTVSLNSYKGQTVQIYFNATNDVSNPTSFFLDDVSVVAS